MDLAFRPAPVPADGRTVRRAAWTVAMTAWPLLLAPATADAQPIPPLQVSASVYGWFPDIGGQTRFTSSAGGGEFKVDVADLLRNLEFTFQGSVDIRRGPWGAIVDVIYMSVGQTRDDVRSGTIGGTGIPAGAAATTEFDMKSRIWTVAGYYRVVERPELAVDVVAGVRHLDVEQSLDWTVSGNVGAIPAPGRAGSARASLGYLDALVGVRVRAAASADGRWFLPAYADVGTGESDLTWQFMGGVGYAFDWGEAVAAWRHMEYRLPSDGAVTRLKFDGPMIGATFRW